ncbi:phosphoglycerate mutase [Sulfitobacter alexandrii]|uniref:Phosphoglycerate mutase n=1 Tax=Sulfitobacter alexandrii TaxID=1917485 RepID=A0A1J0WJQ1_9RHOB|nr:histidine phosphatase family protein [Sulfitobacter alexandrii]APE44538.1 phosphoglycerate mutase [Sulfitobacter alexandrii]
MTRLALLRHGHTAWNRAGRIQGRTDVPLDDAARAQLADLSLPAPWDRAAIWSSPLQRAVETARLVSGRDPRTDPALTEMHWGDWEGRTRPELHADPACDYRPIEAWGWDHAPPGGESPARVRDRLLPWAQAMTQDAVAVCHIGVMRVLLARAHGWDFDGPAPFAVKRNRLYVIDITASGWRPAVEPVRLIGGTS